VACPSRDGCREPSPVCDSLGPSGFHPHASDHRGLRAPLAYDRTQFRAWTFPPALTYLPHPIRNEAEQMAWSFWKDNRPEWVQAEERAFIKAANGLKTLQVTPRGGMRIDPEEIRDQVVSARELYKGLVKK
jgi:hypothetical protein